MSASSRRVTWTLTAVCLAGLVLRLPAIDFGLPAVYNPDEVAIMNRAVALGQNGLNPGNFLYPTFYFYALFAWEGLLFVAGWLLGWFGSLSDFERQYFVDPSPVYVAGRLLSVLCGTATIWITARLGARLFGPIAGLAAAALVAVAPLAVRDAHYVKHDVPVTLLIAAAHLALAVAVTGRSSPRAWWVAAVLAGLAFSTHYYAIFVFVPVTLLALSAIEPGEAWSARSSRAAQTVGVGGLAFVAASPFLLVDAGTAYRDIVANREIVVDRATATSGAFASLGFYVEWLATDAAGRLAALLALAGAAVAISRGWMPVVLTLGFPLVFLFFMANTVPASRYLNPVLPFVAVLGGAAVAWVHARPARVAPIGAAALLAFACVEGGMASVRTNRFFSRPDTRTLGLEWIAANVPSGTSVLIQPYSVPLRPSREGLAEALTEHLGSADAASVRFQRQLALDPYPEPSYRTIYLGRGGLDVDKIYIDPGAITDTTGLAPVREAGVTLVVMKRYNDRDPAMVPIERALEREGTLTATFSPYRPETDDARRRTVAPFLHNTDARIDRALERPGPIIDIWTIH